jgi:hypothetical protein
MPEQKHTAGKVIAEFDDYDESYSVLLDEGLSNGQAYICSHITQGEDEGKADADFIALCWNSHDSLVAALKELVEYEGEVYAHLSRWGDDCRPAEKAYAAARAALKLGGA